MLSGRYSGNNRPRFTLRVIAGREAGSSDVTFTL